MIMMFAARLLRLLTLAAPLVLALQPSQPMRRGSPRRRRAL